ncbi:MAG: Fpg/Nei family DNA glycosylase [Phycisphaerae bacterium]
MPELPDVLVYCDVLQRVLVGATIRDIRILGPSLLRTFDPPIEQATDRNVIAVHRRGKRIAFELTDAHFLVFHLMIAGRFRWLTAEARPPAKITQAMIRTDDGALAVTEASKKKRATLHYVVGKEALNQFSTAALDLCDAKLDEFCARLQAENRTVKRMLTSPAHFDGVGNAYSDEILHRARLSPIKQTRKLSEDEIARLHKAACDVLNEWTNRLRDEFRDRFPGPGEITAFRPDFAVHGKFGQPCPDCGAPVQRILYAENECNYCARCQNAGRVLADRSLSRLLKDDWPRAIEDWM